MDVARKRKRNHLKIHSILDYWISNGYQVAWLTLTTAPGGSAEKLTAHHDRLRRMVERKYGYDPLEFLAVRTEEGLGVIHALWAWQAPDVKPRRRLYVPRPWLQERWEQLHGAWGVHIGAYSDGTGGRTRIANYLLNQRGPTHFSSSWKRTAMNYPPSTISPPDSDPLRPKSVQY